MNVVKFAETIKDNIDADLCSGNNIATKEAAEDLISMGVDGLKVGIILVLLLLVLLQVLVYLNLLLFLMLQMSLQKIIFLL